MVGGGSEEAKERRKRLRGREGTEKNKASELKTISFSSLFSPTPVPLGYNSLSYRVRGILLVLGGATEAEEGLGRGDGDERGSESRGDGGACGERRAARGGLVFFFSAVFLFGVNFNA